MSDDPLVGMRERAAKCRWLAKEMLDKKTIQALLEMADEIERDMKLLEAERLARPIAASTPPSEETMPTITIKPE